MPPGTTFTHTHTHTHSNTHNSDCTKCNNLGPRAQKGPRSSFGEHLHSVYLAARLGFVVYGEADQAQCVQVSQGAEHESNPHYVRISPRHCHLLSPRFFIFTFYNQKWGQGQTETKPRSLEFVLIRK